MSLELTCSCGKQLRVPDRFAGEAGLCPACGASVPILIRGAVNGEEPAAHASNLAITKSLGATSPIEETAAEAPPSRHLATGPVEVLEIARPDYKLFSPDCIGAVAFLTGPVGPFMLLGLNYSRVGKQAAAWVTLGAGLVTVVGAAFLALSLPRSIFALASLLVIYVLVRSRIWKLDAGRFLLSFLAMFLVMVAFLLLWNLKPHKALPVLNLSLALAPLLWGLAHWLQDWIYVEHERHGGEPASNWWAAGIGVIGLGAFAAVAFGLSTKLDADRHRGLGEKIEIAGGHEVYYTKGITRAEAEAVGDFVKQSGSFESQDIKLVRLYFEHDWLIITFVVPDRVRDDRDARHALHELGKQAIKQIFETRLFEVELADDRFEERRRL